VTTDLHAVPGLRISASFTCMAPVRFRGVCRDNFTFTSTLKCYVATDLDNNATFLRYAQIHVKHWRSCDFLCCGGNNWACKSSGYGTPY
jgi:hypothetical protein